MKVLKVSCCYKIIFIKGIIREKLTIHKILVNSVTSLKIPLGQIYRQPYQLQAKQNPVSMFIFSVINIFGRQAEATKIPVNGEEENWRNHIYPNENTI